MSNMYQSESCVLLLTEFLIDKEDGYEFTSADPLHAIPRRQSNISAAISQLCNHGVASRTERKIAYKGSRRGLIVYRLHRDKLDEFYQKHWFKGSTEGYNKAVKFKKVSETKEITLQHDLIPYKDPLILERLELLERRVALLESQMRGEI